MISLSLPGSIAAPALCDRWPSSCGEHRFCRSSLRGRCAVTGEVSFDLQEALGEGWLEALVRQGCQRDTLLGSQVVIYLGSVVVSSRLGAVVEVDHAVPKTALIQQFEPHTDIIGEGLFASSYHDGCEEQLALVDQTGPECVGGKLGTAHGHVTTRRRFHLQDRFGVEVPFELGLGSGYFLQSRGVYDLVGSFPDLGEVARTGRLLGGRGVGLPDNHQLVHSASVEVGA